MKFTEFLVRDAILPNLASSTRDEAIREIVRGFQGAGRLADLDPEELTQALLWREGLGSTAIGRGVAVPHGGHPSIDRAIASIALAPQGVGFSAIDGKPVDVLVTHFHRPITGQPVRKDDPGESLNAFEAIVRYIQDDAFLARLRRCRTREEIYDLIVEVERDPT